MEIGKSDKSAHVPPTPPHPNPHPPTPEPVFQHSLPASSADLRTAASTTVTVDLPSVLNAGGFTSLPSSWPCCFVFATVSVPPLARWPSDPLGEWASAQCFPALPSDRSRPSRRK